jgi:hypothetical protein
MRVMFFGSRSLTWRHLPVLRALALHASLDLAQYDAGHSVPHMDLDLMRLLMAGGDDEWPALPESEPLILLHGDGPPGKVPGAIGADKLAELACMEGWPERRRLKRFPVEQHAGETWGQAAARRNAAMVAARPHRAYAIHTDLDASKGSSMTASFLTSAGIPYWYVRVRQSGELVSVEQR